MREDAFYNHPKVRQARQLLCEAEQEMRAEQQREADSTPCECGHLRNVHGPAHSINYTGGVCKQCKCMHFLAKPASLLSPAVHVGKLDFSTPRRPSKPKGFV